MKRLFLIFLLCSVLQAADTKLTGLDELTAIASTDMFYIVDDPSGTPLSKKITALNIFDLIDTYAELNTIVADATLTHNGLIDTFSELNAIVADKTLVNEEDAAIWDALGTFNLGITITTGDPFTLGVVRWDNGSDLIDGEQIAADTIDNDSIDWGDMTDLTTDGALDADVVDEAHIADNGIDSEHYNDGSIDLVHIAAAAYAKDLVTTSPITGAADNIFVGADSDVTVALTMLKDIVTTAPLTGAENDVLPGADADLTLALDFTAAWDFGGAASLEIPNGADPDVSVAGQVSIDTDGGNEPNDVSLRTFEATGAQHVLASTLKTISFTLISPDTIDAADLIPVWHNTSGYTFHITEWKAWSDDDNVTLEIEELTDQTNYTAITTVDAVEIATDGTGVYYASDTTITHATIEHDHSLAIDFDTSDTPDYVQISITGYFDGDVN